MKDKKVDGFGEKSSKRLLRKMKQLHEDNIRDFQKKFRCVVDEKGKVETAYVDVGMQVAVDVGDLDISINEYNSIENYTMKLQTLRHRVARVSDGDQVYGTKWIEFYENGVEGWLVEYCTDSEKVCGDCKDDMKEEKKDYFTKLAEKYEGKDYFTKLAEKNVDKMEDV